MSSRLLLALALCVFFFATAQAHSEPSLEATVADLSERLSAVEEENQQLRWLVETTACDSQPHQPHPINLSGRIHVDYWAFPGDSPGTNAFDSGSATISPQDRLELRRARLAVEGELPLDVLYKLDFEFSEASDPEFRDLYIGWDDLPWLGQLLIGNQKRPYGLDHLNSSNFNVFMERPFVVQAFNRNNRRFGIASHNVSANENWNWRFGIFNLREIQSDGVFASDHYQLELAGRIARSIYDRCDESRYAHMAIAASYAEPDGVPTPGREVNQARFRTEPEARTNSQWLDTGVIDGAEDYGILGLESAVNLGKFQVTTEYLNLWLDRRAGMGEPLHFHGGYVQISYFLTDHFQPWNRRLGIIDRVTTLERSNCRSCWRPAWQAAVRWSFADLTDHDVQGGVGESIAAGLNWYWSPRARLQFNCLYGEISDHAPVDGFTSGTYTAIGTRVLVDF
ncbi:MAG: OprO/OprP family phosphate-selective porin [Aeoliella sp.]